VFTHDAAQLHAILSGLMVHESWRGVQYFAIVGMPGGLPRLWMMAFSASEKCENSSAYPLINAKSEKHVLGSFSEHNKKK
jgi:hypothetical protein